MSQPVALEFNGRPVRVLSLGQTPWVVAADLARALGYTDADKMMRLVSTENRRLQVLRSRTMLLVNEAGLLEIVSRSNKPNVGRLLRWLEREVRPALAQQAQQARAEGKASQKQLKLWLEAASASLSDMDASAPTGGPSADRKAAGDASTDKSAQSPQGDYPASVPTVPAAKELFEPTLLVREAQMHFPIRDRVAAILLAGAEIMKVPGVEPAVVMAMVLECIQKNTGLDVEMLRRLLPSEGCTARLNATQVGERLGLSAKETNLLLEEMGLQRRNARGEWALTQEGQKWGRAVPFSRNGHNGYQLLWKPEVVDHVSSRFVERLKASLEAGMKARHEARSPLQKEAERTEEK